MYTIGRNGRLNVWECDTRLDGLIKQNKNEANPEFDLDSDEFSRSKSQTQAVEDEATDENKEDMETNEDEPKKITIHYRKKAK